MQHEKRKVEGFCQLTLLRLIRGVGALGAERLFYDEPETTTLKLKLVRVPVLDAAVSVSVAEMTAPMGKTYPCLFHVNVRKELAVEGVQFEADMLRVSFWLPVFFM